MSSPMSTPEQYEKTIARNQAKGKTLAQYYIDDTDGSLPRTKAAVDPPNSPTSPKTKKSATRKYNPTTPKKASKTTDGTSSESSPTRKQKPTAPEKIAKITDGTSQESSPTRKSPRIARGENKRSAKAMEADDIAENAKSAPIKKRKISVKSNTKKVDPAAIQPHTGRFTPINAQLKRAKKVEKRPAESDEADAPPKKRAKKNVGTSQVTAADALNDMTQMGILAADDNATEETATEDADTDAAPAKPKGKGKGKGKAKANAKAKATPEKKAAPELTSNQMGSTVEKPAGATNDTAWKCANRSCNTGMTWYKRDGAGGLGRKVISHFFGRNKKETNRIHSEVWHVYCRKCYQRHSYRHKNAQSSCRYFIENIEMQLARLKIWRPQAKFVVQLTKGAQARLSDYRKELRNNGGDEAKAAQQVFVPAEVDPKGKEKPQPLEDSFPIKKMEEFDNTFATTQASYDYDELLSIVSWVGDEVKAHRIITMPPMEFLMNAIADGEETTDPDANYEAWTVLEDKQGSSETDSEEEQTETESTVAGPSGTQNQADDSTDAELAIAGPSGTQNQDYDFEETGAETSESGASTNNQLTGAASLPLYDSSSPTPHTPLEETFMYKANLMLDAIEAKQASEGDTDDDDSESEPEPEEPVTPTPVPKRMRSRKD